MVVPPPNLKFNHKVHVEPAAGTRGITAFLVSAEDAGVSANLEQSFWQAGVNYIQGYYLQGPSQAMDYDFSSGDE